jgi:predicted protein tyrosine phosphatase
VIFVMEKAQLNKLRSRFKQDLRSHQRVVCLDILDDYEYMQPELVKLLQNKVSRFLD